MKPVFLAGGRATLLITSFLISACAQLPAGVAEDVYKGKPCRDGFPHRLRVLDNDGFAVGYSVEHRVPVWVAYRLGPNPGEHDYDRPSDFDADERLRRPVDHDDYTHSGFDRGHLAPNYAIMTRYGRRAQLDTFLMSNVAPMRAALNRGPWLDLEMLLAKGYANEFGEIWVVTGCVFDEQEEELDSEVEIPDGYFKIVIDERDGKPRAQAFAFSEDAGRDLELTDALVSVDRVERLSGLDFFHKLKDPVEQRLERRTAKTLWMDPSEIHRRNGGDDSDDELSGKINVNTASRGELEKLEGIGPVKARRIIEARPYDQVEDLRRVKGIGPKTMEWIRPHVTVGKGGD